MGTDYLFMCPTRASARSMTKSGVPVYYYHFLHSPSTDPSDPWPYCQVRLALISTSLQCTIY
jgi:hypothetical protein